MVVKLTSHVTRTSIPRTFHFVLLTEATTIFLARLKRADQACSLLKDDYLDFMANGFCIEVIYDWAQAATLVAATTRTSAENQRSQP